MAIYFKILEYFIHRNLKKLIIPHVQDLVNFGLVHFVLFSIVHSDTVVTLSHTQVFVGIYRLHLAQSSMIT